MTDVLVQIRAPKQLVTDFKHLPQASHYMDLSEHIREIVREEWLKHTKPDLFELQKLRKEILDELKQQTAAKIKKEIVSELEQIKRQIQHE